MNKHRFLPFFFVLLFFSECLFAQQTITLHSLLSDMTNFETVAKFPSPTYTLKQASSYDRRSVSPYKPGWFANEDFNQFIREEKNNGHTEYVMMDADGPGAIVRFWLTTVVKQGILRFYFDNEKKPTIEIPAFDLMKGDFNLGPALLNPHSSYEPQGKGGNTLYLPLLYQKHCKVTWEYTDEASKKTAHYYQINYRTYAPGTHVKTFAMSDLINERAAINEAEAALWHPAAIGENAIKLNRQLAPGKAAVIHLPAGAKAIRQLQFQLSTVDKDNYEKMWRAVVLKLEFDGAQTVYCPLGDFIGSGYGGRTITSWYRDLDTTGQAACRWVMPYKRSATITFVNNADFNVNINATAVVSPIHWDNRTMYFHTTYKYEANVKDVKADYDINRIAQQDTAGPIDWNFITIRGKGVYMGNTFSVYNHMNAWYGEGDAKAYIDNEAFPSEFGTGLEDYYNTSWAPVVLYQTPFANAPRADSASSAGYNTFTRTRNLDRIPFTKAFHFDMEMLSWTGGTVDAAATTYWYGFKGATAIVQNK